METTEKQFVYANMIQRHLEQMFNDEDCQFFISAKELEEGNNLTHFMHALANLVPTSMYNELAGEENNQLEFNHLANTLCFQYMKRK